MQSIARYAQPSRGGRRDETAKAQKRSHQERVQLSACERRRKRVSIL